ncbi:hypothetical protein [Legionella donaldsonii]|uniref:hypothetical protein n=1 Tax=Legionella donaldsonii TaxID=45060 RepID=UPI00399D0227
MPPSHLNQLKDSFFNKKPKVSEAFDFKAADFNLNQLDAEFSSLYQLFLSNKKRWEKDRDNDIVCCMEALCDLMILYYQCNYDEATLNDLQKKKAEIVSFKTPSASSKSKEGKKAVPLSSFLRNKVSDTVSDYKASLTDSAKFRDNISNLNNNRIYWIYCHGMINNAIVLLQKSGIPDYLKRVNATFGHHYSMDDFVKALDKPQQVLYVLSVSIYALRFIINLVTVTKRVMDAESGNDLSGKKVLKQELEKSGFSMLNDSVWGTVNLLTNYNKLFHISVAAADKITVAFLVFDVALILASWLFEKAKYNHRIAELEEQQTTGLPKSVQQLAVINRQIDILNDEWAAQTSYYAFNVIAASAVVAGFGATLIFTGGLSLAYLAALSMLGTAMYVSADDYKTYKNSTIAIQRELVNGKLVDDTIHQELLIQLKKESSDAYSNFWKGLFYNTTGPAFFITAAAVSWPVALLMTAAYLFYQIDNSHKESMAENNSVPETPGIYRLIG